jgi:short-subunit dehydrogenase involved in D-alanine esterification of teichoic acids
MTSLSGKRTLITGGGTGAGADLPRAASPRRGRKL